MSSFVKANMLSPVDSSIWEACAGNSVKIPAVDSRVYYFPQGHAEHASSPPDFSSLISLKPYVLCKVLSVHFLANADTDEVFAKIALQPLTRSYPTGIYMSPVGSVSQAEEEPKEKIVSFTKILTPSDANNGGGFSVPRFCADSIFPPLDYNKDPPVQNIDVTDLHGTVWNFRHIYRGTPRRHLLTTGWSKYVTNKKLVAGDSVVFMRNQIGELFIGLRRIARVNGIYDSKICNSSYSVVHFSEEESGNQLGNGKILPESVVEAAELAGAGKPFEIIYYPRADSPDFVVRAEIVDESMPKFWSGARVKMAVEHSSRMTWFQGTVLATVQASGPWHGSPWRMLQVLWDEPEILQNLERVSPWKVELIASAPSPPLLQAPFSPIKRLRVSQSHDLLTVGEHKNLYLPMAGSTNSMMENLNPSFFIYNSSPAGMQGARQDSYYASNFSNFVVNNSHPIRIDHQHGDVAPKSSVSTDLSIGSTSQSDYSSPPSKSSVHSSTKELFSNHKCSSTRKSGLCSFQLFGKLIQTSQSVESGSDDDGCSEDDGCKGCKRSEVFILL